MRRWGVRVLCGLGGFLVVVGLMALVWVPGAVKKTPIDVDQTTYLDGEAAKIDLESGELVRNPIYAISITRTDSEASDDDTVAWTQSACVMIDRGGERECVDRSPDMITASVNVFATDRVTGLADNDGAELPRDAVPHEGLVNKWPFDAEQKTYPYWDAMLGEAVDAVFERTDELRGTEVHVYQVSVTDAVVDVAPDTPGTYSTDKEIWVEPRTGAVINQVESQQRYLEDGTQVLDLQLGFTDDQIATSVASNRDDVARLQLTTVTVPLVGLVGGPLLLLVGGVLAWSGRRTRGAASQETREPVGAGV